MNPAGTAGSIRPCSCSVAPPNSPPSYRETVLGNGNPTGYRCQCRQSPGTHLLRGDGGTYTVQPRGYGTVPNNTSPVVGRTTSPASPSLPLHFTMSHEPQGGPFRMVVVSVIMCALLADTDQRLLNGVVFEKVSAFALLFLSGAREVLLDLTWSMVIATLTAFFFPLNIIAFLIGVDWIIPGRLVSTLLGHSQETVSVLFYLITLFVAGWLPPLLPIRWAIDWVLGYFPRVERRR